MWREGGRSTKKQIFAQGEIEQKSNSHAPLVILKKYSCPDLKNSYEENVNKK